MRLVVDSNVVLATLIRPCRPLNLFLLDSLELFAPELLLAEVAKHRDDIYRKSRLSSEDIEGLLQVIKEGIVLVPDEVLIPHRPEALAICPDPKDVSYFAAALYLQCPLWSSEKKLKNQCSIKVYSTHELMQEFIDLLPPFP